MTRHDDRIDLHIGADTEPRVDTTESSDGVFRIALFGAFAGDNPQSPRAAGDATRRTSRRVDRDDLDAAIAGFAPVIQVLLDPDDGPVTISFSSLDDFHPDSLAERVPIFRRLRELRDGFAARGDRAPRPVTGKSNAAVSTSILNPGSLLDDILANQSEPSSRASSAATGGANDELSQFVSRAVAPHIVSEPTSEQRAMMSKVDDVMVAMMRVLLHDPAFQALEAAWRSVDFLVRRLDTSVSLQLHLVAVTSRELSTADDRALHQILRGASDSAGGPWSLIVADHVFGPDDMETLARVAAGARAFGTPFLAGAHARLAGAPSFSGTPDVDDWDSTPLPEWDAFRRTPDARYLSLACPRILLRLPYGKRGEPCTAFPFEEMPDGAPVHDAYLWGVGALLGALAIGEAVADDEDPPTHTTIGSLPLHVAMVDGVAEATPCAEAFLSQRAVAWMLDRGLTVLASARDGDDVRLPRLQSVAFPSAPLIMRSMRNC
jgi:predicted component of type VI protein secretion system